MELYVVRHGETFSNTGENKDVDALLTPLGIEQADYLGKSLADVHFDKIYASHLSRAVHTASQIAKYQNVNLPITIVPEFAERGTPIDFCANEEFHNSVYDNIVYDKKSIQKDYHGDIERVQYALDKYIYHTAYDNPIEQHIEGSNLIKSNPEKILIVAHGGTNAIILSCLVGFRFDMNMNVVQQNTCVNRFELFTYNGIPRIRFISYNDISHLPENLVTKHL